ncbi:hypothetical protein [Nonomuraea diastatica]|uniref:Uncharacterized protein n=1 Tax=Nonomuraea diastatica TaxID=1848329 RepID=A0A4R4X5W9_9ACTN|nr:hypothetical protein [Nonomuraea diastatica]TDD25712.1 hypothetical protein E1294_02005 [Nonomuraea diastatica]
MRDSARLGDALTTAVNLAAGVRERPQAAGAAPEQTCAQLADLRERGVEAPRPGGQAGDERHFGRS